MWARDPTNGGDAVAKLEAALATETKDLADAYALFCKSLDRKPHSGVLFFLRLGLSALRPSEQGGEGHFTDADLYAFCDFVMRGSASRVFDHWTCVDLSSRSCTIGELGCRMLARVLRLPGCHVHTVNISRQRVGAEGTAALVQAIRENRSISNVNMYLCFVEDRGANELLELLCDGEGAHRLTELDLSNNMLTFPTCQKLQLAAPKELKLVLSGNRVLDEVLNASSHFVGIILTVIGAVFLAVECADRNIEWETNHVGEKYMGTVVSRTPYTVSSTIYLLSLFVLYVASTLYHATFALGERVVNIFTILDHCAIYLLIAGTYTPFLLILFPDKLVYSVGLLGFLWAMALCGIGIAAFLEHSDVKVNLHIGSYVGMGWACIVCAKEMYERMSPEPMGLVLLVAGGIFYTAGVPFVVKDKRSFGIPDHTIWHVFVLAGSISHYFAIFYYLMSFPYDGQSVHLPILD